MLRDIPFTACY